MKKFSIRVCKTDTIGVVKLDDLFIAEDLSYVSGVCSPNVSIVNDGKCSVSIDSGATYITAYCDTQVVKRMGFVMVEGRKLYVENGSVHFNGSEYKATYIKNGSNTAFESAYCVIGDERYDIQDCQSQQWKSVRNVKISNSKTLPIKLTDCECIGEQDSVLIEGEPYDVLYNNGKPYIIYEGISVYAESYDEDGEEYYLHEDLSDKWIELNDTTLGLQGRYSVKTYEKACEEGNSLNLFVNKYETEISSIREKDILHFSYVGENDLVDFMVERNEDNEPYIDYYGTMYQIVADKKVCAIVDNGEYEVVLTATTEDPQMKIGHLKDYENAVVSAYTDSMGVVTEVYRRLLVENGNDKYWSNEKVDFVSYSGITMDGIDYYVEQGWNYNFDNEEEEELLPSSQYITLPNHLDLYCSVDKVNIGGSMLKVYPISLNGIDFDRNYEEQFPKILGSIANNIEAFSVVLLRNLFGLHIDGVGELFDYNKETLQDYLLIRQTDNGIKLSVPFEKDTALNLKNEWNIKELLDERLVANINGHTDAERDIYVPTFADEDGILHLLKTLKFNLHFRTRKLEDWSVIEDNVELNNDGCSSWNCIDHYYNTYENKADGSVVYTNDDRERYADKLVFSSDLLHFLNFTDKDVFYQKSALSKSFLRLSFFDSPIPNQQSLLWTSTLFFDEGSCYMKYINNVENKSFVEYKNLRTKELGTINTRSEVVDEHKNPTFDNDKRLCMEFSASNKITSRVSSEGFYLYIYKEYSNHLHPRRIYMRVDFNHAKNGKSVPMMLLKHHNEDGTTYQANCIKDVFDMREGVPMGDMLSYIYIPIIVRYDDNLQKYTYMFEHLVEKETENLEINLFEVKYKDESK